MFRHHSISNITYADYLTLLFVYFHVWEIIMWKQKWMHSVMLKQNINNLSPTLCLYCILTICFHISYIGTCNTNLNRNKNFFVNGQKLRKKLCYTYPTNTISLHKINYVFLLIYIFNWYLLAEHHKSNNPNIFQSVAH